MKTHVEFVSNAFPAYPGEEDEINPGIWGKRLAEFIHEGRSHVDSLSSSLLRKIGAGWSRSETMRSQCRSDVQISMSMKINFYAHRTEQTLCPKIVSQKDIY
jgi:hypothetical protein